MTFREMIAYAIEFEPLQNTIAKDILQKILDILKTTAPKELPPPGQ